MLPRKQNNIQNRLKQGGVHGPNKRDGPHPDIRGSFRPRGVNGGVKVPRGVRGDDDSDDGNSSNANSHPPQGPELPPPQPKKQQEFPQKSIDRFWKTFVSKKPGKVFSVLPKNLYAKHVAAAAATGGAQVETQNCATSYDDAAKACREKVEKIILECRRLNRKYRDPHFDIGKQFYGQYQGITNDCLDGLLATASGHHCPGAVQRVEVLYPPQS